MSSLKYTEMFCQWNDWFEYKKTATLIILNSRERRIVPAECAPNLANCSLRPDNDAQFRDQRLSEKSVLMFEKDRRMLSRPRKTSCPDLSRGRSRLCSCIRLITLCPEWSLTWTSILLVGGK